MARKAKRAANPGLFKAAFGKGTQKAGGSVFGNALRSFGDLGAGIGKGAVGLVKGAAPVVQTVTPAVQSVVNQPSVSPITPKLFDEDYFTMENLFKRSRFNSAMTNQGGYSSGLFTGNFPSYSINTTPLKPL